MLLGGRGAHNVVTIFCVPIRDSKNILMCSSTQFLPSETSEGLGKLIVDCCF